MTFKARDFREAPRPNHPDAMDASELRKINFTGIRNNSLDNSIECWLEGEIRFYVTELENQLNPGVFARKYEEVFALYKVEQVPMKGN